MSIMFNQIYIYTYKYVFIYISWGKGVYIYIYNVLLSILGKELAATTWIIQSSSN